MSDILRIGFADSVYTLNNASPVQRELVRSRFGPLLTDAAEREISIEVERGEPREFPQRPSGPFVYLVDVTHHGHETRMSGPGFSATVERPSLRTRLRTCLEDEWFSAAFENVFRCLASLRLFSEGRLVLHSGAFTDGRRSFLFCGRSGAGKSTLCSLADGRGLQVLSDELNALGFDGDRLTIHAMPFAGDFGGVPAPRSKYPLTALLGLQQSEKASLQPCSRAQALSRIVAACPYINTDEELSEGLWAIAAQIVEAAPLQILSFPKNQSFWSVLNHEYPGPQPAL
jgi:hypothetical protein